MLFNTAVFKLALFPRNADFIILLFKRNNNFYTVFCNLNE